jgi:hypothetical protein
LNKLNKPKHREQAAELLAFFNSASTPALRWKNLDQRCHHCIDLVRCRCDRLTWAEAGQESVDCGAVERSIEFGVKF